MAGALWRRADVLRYGENPHQRAALYKDLSAERTGADHPAAGEGIAAAELLHGKAMSYNNYVDADAARRAAYDFAEPCVAIIKHSNPCGIAIGADLAEAHAKAHACDPASAFGGVIAANGPADRRAGPADRRGVHRGGDRARFRCRGAGHPVRGQEHPPVEMCWPGGAGSSPQGGLGEDPPRSGRIPGGCPLGEKSGGK